MRHIKCLIIGAGPCGISTAIKLKELGIEAVVVEKAMPGGKVNIAPRVDNYPGYEKISGPDLAMVYFNRLNENNIEMIADEITSLTKEDNGFIAKGLYESYSAEAVVLASGTSEKKLGLKREDEFLGHGLSYCALCDGHFFRNKTVVVVGSGDVAYEEAIHLADLCSHVSLLLQPSTLVVRKTLIEELKNKPNVTIFDKYSIKELLGDSSITGLLVKDRENGKEETINTDGVFVAIGRVSNSSYVSFKNIKNDDESIKVNNLNKDFSTEIPGLFAGGDVLSRTIKQIYLAEHDGLLIAQMVKEYLTNE